MSLLNIIQGDVDPLEVHKSLQRIRERQQIKMMGWGPSGIQVALGNFIFQLNFFFSYSSIIARRSPYLKSKNRVSGLMLANHTSIHKLFMKSCSQFDKLRSRNAFLEHYKKYDIFKNGLEEFDESRAVVGELIEEYIAAGKNDFLEYLEKKEKK